MKALQQVLKQKDTTLKRLTERMAHLEKISRVVSIALPEEWRTFCKIVRIDLNEKKIVLSISEQNLLTPIRFMQEIILKVLHQNYAELKKIEKVECIYTPTLTSSVPKKTRQHHRSAIAAKACLQAAEACSGKLKKALEKLARQLERN